MNEAEMVEAVEIDVYPGAAAAMTEAGGGWFGREMAVKAARLVVAAWAMAVNGDETALAAMADPDRVRWLLYPDSYPHWRRQWVIAPGPALIELAITRLEAAADPPELTVKWQFTGRRRWVDPDPADIGTPDDEVFVGILTLALTGSGPWPWRPGPGSHVCTLDDFLGHTFARRTETVEEYRQRTADDGGPLAPTDTYRVEASFFEHDVKFGSGATLEVARDPAPTREEAARLVWPAMLAECVRGNGGVAEDWRPSLNSLRVIRLLGPA